MNSISYNHITIIIHIYIDVFVTSDNRVISFQSEKTHRRQAKDGEQVRRRAGVRGERRAVELQLGGCEGERHRELRKIRSFSNFSR